MTKYGVVLVLCGVALCAAVLEADRLTLRNGKTVDGIYVGGDSAMVRFAVKGGATTEYPVGSVAGVQFASRQPAPPPAAPDPAKAPRPVTVPAGTVIAVRLSDAIDVDSTQVGQTFKARVDDPVMVDGKVIIPREASAIVQAVKVGQSGTIKGADQVAVKLNSVSFGGARYEVATSQADAKSSGKGKSSARKIGGGAGLGALVGGIAGGGEGAAVGALVGAGIGTAAAAATGEKHLVLPAETRLQFTLSAAVTVGR